MHCNKYAICDRNASEYPDTGDNTEISDDYGVVEFIRLIAVLDDGLEQQLARSDHLHRIVNGT